MLQETSDLLKKKMKEKKILHASSLEVGEEDLSKMPKDAKKKKKRNVKVSTSKPSLSKNHLL